MKLDITLPRGAAYWTLQETLDKIVSSVKLEYKELAKKTTRSEVKFTISMEHIDD